MCVRIVRIIFLAILCHTASAGVFPHFVGGAGSVPPEYLRVPKWQKCVQNILCGHAKFICLPKSKPAVCPLSSWRILTKKHLLSHCTQGCKGLGS